MKTTSTQINALHKYDRSEIENMKKAIIGHCEYNNKAPVCNEYTCFNEYSAKSLRTYYECEIKEYEGSPRYQNFYKRRLALYELLTTNDKPNFLN